MLIVVFRFSYNKRVVYSYSIFGIQIHAVPLVLLDCILRAIIVCQSLLTAAVWITCRFLLSCCCSLSCRTLLLHTHVCRVECIGIRKGRLVFVYWFFVFSRALTITTISIYDLHVEPIHGSRHSAENNGDFATEIRFCALLIIWHTAHRQRVPIILRPFCMQIDAVTQPSERSNMYWPRNEDEFMDFRNIFGNASLAVTHY